MQTAGRKPLQGREAFKLIRFRLPRHEECDGNSECWGRIGLTVSPREPP